MQLTEHTLYSLTGYTLRFKDINTVTLDLRRYNELALAEQYLKLKNFIYSKQHGWQAPGETTND